MNVGAQIKGIVITLIVAVITGLIAGKIISFLGRRAESYIDSEEFEV